MLSGGILSAYPLRAAKVCLERLLCDQLIWTEEAQLMLLETTQTCRLATKPNTNTVDITC